MSAPLTASASDLAYCDPDVADCSCSPTEADGYDGCAVGDFSDTIIVDDPLELRSVYNVEVVHVDDANGVVALSARADGFVPSVMLVGPGQGHWEDEQQLADFVNLTIYGSIPDPTSDLPIYSPCPPFVPMYSLQMTGTLARIDADSGQWAAYQTQDLIKAAISDAEGRVWVDGKPVWQFVNINEEPCANPTNDEFSGTQCSQWSEEGGTESRILCGEVYEPGTSAHDLSSTTMKGFRWEYNHSKIEIILGGGIRWRPVRADWIDVDGLYYTSSTATAESKDTRRVYDEPQETNHMPRAGTCGFGVAEKNGLVIAATTRAGASPNSCPSNPF